MPGPIAKIQETVAAEFGVTMLELLSPRRPKRLVQARMMSMTLARELTGASYPLIGRTHGDRDHTTSLNAVRRDRELIHRDAEYAAMRRTVLVKLTQ
jgi:chromosomal replication initiator protein